MLNREEQIAECVKEIENICSKYNVSLDILEDIDYDYEETPYISGTSIILTDEIDGRKISWSYYDMLNK